MANTNITINIVEPGTPPSPTPDPVVPNTGLFTSGIGGPEATAIGTVLVLTIAAIVVAVCYRKQKKSGKVQNAYADKTCENTIKKLLPYGN